MNLFVAEDLKKLCIAFYHGFPEIRNGFLSSEILDI
jgi:hypothetical protein